jgi:hypothetical protein
MEAKLATIPRVVVAGAFGPKEYGILLTDRRMIFVLEFSSKAGIAGALGGAIGAVIATAAESRRSTNEVNYADADPDELAGHEKSFVVPYAGIESLIVERKLGSYRLLIEYANAEGKRKKIAAMIAPPRTTVSQNKALGVTPKDTAAEYARTVQAALQKALPPSAATKAAWRL